MKYISLLFSLCIIFMIVIEKNNVEALRIAFTRTTTKRPCSITCYPNSKLNLKKCKCECLCGFYFVAPNKCVRKK